MIPSSECRAKGDTMELTLRYSGPLPPVNDRDRRVPEKHHIRKQFHEQLRYFWRNDHNRLQFGKVEQFQIAEVRGPHINVVQPLKDFWHYFYRFQLGGFDFVPLVTHLMGARCELAVRIHQASEPGQI